MWLNNRCYQYFSEKKIRNCFGWAVKYKEIIPTINKVFYIKISDRNIVLDEIPENEKGENLYIKVEMDLLYKEDGEWIIMECKSYGKLKNSLINSIENTIHVVRKKMGTPKKVILMIHKFDF